jgi:hypothetical protein
MSEPVRPVQAAQPAQPVQPAQHASPVVPVSNVPPVPAPGHGRADDARAADESVRRKLLMGAALLLALTSIYAGVFNVGRLAQIVLAAGATMAMVLALTSRRRRDS